MSSQISRGILAPLAWLVVAIVVVILFRGFGIEKYRDQKVSAGEIRKPWDVFAVHLSRPQYLKVGGKTYRGVRGLTPYYLDVPGTDSVMFVTENAGKIAFHIVNTKSGESIKIDARDSTFGWSIGSKRVKDEPFTDWIESVNNGQMILGKRTDVLKVMTHLDLSKKIVMQEEVLYLDMNGQVTNRMVYAKDN